MGQGVTGTLILIGIVIVAVLIANWLQKKVAV